MTATQTFTGTLVTESCCTCFITFGMPEDMQRARRADHVGFFCPAGHKQYYTGKSDLEVAQAKAARLERDLNYTRASRDAARDQAAAAERSARAYKGHATRLRNLIAKGICPCCRRNFANVREHMATQHPDFHTHEEQS